MLRRAVYAIVAVIAVLAVLTLAIRLILPQLRHYEDEIVVGLSEIIGAEVQIGSMQASLSGIEPVVELSQVHVTTPSGEALRAGQVRIEFDVWASLLQRQPVISDLHVVAIDFLIATGTDGSSRVFGVPLSLLAAGVLVKKEPVQGLPNLNFRFEQANVRWRNEQAGTDYEFENVSAVLESEDGRLKFALKGSPPPVFGQLLHVAADLRGIGGLDKPWRGQVYLRADEADLAAWARLIGRADAAEGVLTAELWSDWRGGDLQRLDGAVSCAACAGGNSEPMSGQTRLSWEAQEAAWRLGLLDTTLTGPGSAKELMMEHGDAAFVYRDVGSRVVLRVPTLNKTLLRAANAVAQGVEVSAARGNAALSAAIAHPDFKPPRLSHAPSLQEMSAWGDWFESRLRFTAEYVSRYADYLLMHSTIDSAQLELGLEGGTARFPAYSKHVLQFDEFMTSVRYLNHGSAYSIYADELSVVSDGARINGRGVWFDGESPQVQADLEVRNLALTSIKQWLPNEKIKPRLKAWLEQAFIAGTLKSGRAEINGALSSFPFKDGGGRFHFEGEVTAAELNYRAGHKPLREINAHLVFDDQSLVVEASNLRYYDFQSQAAQAVVQDITLPFIEVEASGAGAFASVFAYLKDAQLIAADSVVMNRFMPGGGSRLKLSVKAPLSKKVEKPLTVEGALSFDHASLEVVDSGIEFSDIAGVLHFDRNGGHAESLTAKLNGFAVKGSAKPAGERAPGATALTLEGTLEASQLLDVSKTPLHGAIEGAAPWQADLLIPGLNTGPGAKAGYELKMTLTSSLEGTAVKLPAPFNKSAAQRRDFSAQIVLGTRNEYELSYGEEIKAMLVKDGRAQTPGQTPGQTPWGYLHFGAAPPPAIERDALKISGEISAAVEMDDWLRLAGGDPDPEAYPDHVDLSFAELRKGGATLGEVSLAMESHLDGHKLQIAAPWAQGWGFLPGTDDRAIFIKMEKLSLPKSLSTATTNLKPATVPALEIEVADFKRGDMQVSDLRLITEPIDDGMRIGTLTFEVGEVLVDMSGKWRFDGQQHHSEIELDVNGNNYGKMLDLLGFSNSFKGGSGSLNGRVSWVGAPADFALEKIEGDIYLSLKDGVIEKADPNIGRLLGLFSVSHIVRRLSLDFSDVFKKGLAFDTMEGNHLNFHNGVMHTEGFSIVGPALAMTVSGDNLIAERRYDQQIDVVPNLSSGLPIAGALLGGPIAGAAVLLIDKFTRLGSQMDKIVTLRYRLHGSWDDPQMDFEGTPEVERKKLGGVKKWFGKFFPKANK